MEVAPNDPRAWMLHAAGFSSNQRPAEARASLAKAVEVAPDYTPALAAAAQNNTFVPRDLNAAERYAQRFLQLEPKEIRALTLMGSVRTLQGRFHDAIATYTTLATLDPSSTPLTLRAAPQALKGDSEGALADLDLAYARADSNQVINLAERLILVHALRGDLASAAKAADRGYADARRVGGANAAPAISFIGGAHVSATSLLGNVAAAEEALVSMRRALENVPAPDTLMRPFLAGNIMLSEGTIAAARRDAAGARASGTKILADTTMNALAGHSLMAMADMVEAKYDDALGHFAKASQTDLVTMYRRGLALQGAGRAAEAKPLFERVANENVLSPATLLHAPARQAAAAIR